MYRIMIVEDEPPITRYLSKLIAVHCRGFEVAATADNGAEALQQIAAARPDVILTDIKMPVMDGIELVKTVKEVYPEIYSVIVSGYQDFDYAREALKSGVVDYLLKPVDPEQLNELFDNLAVRLDGDYHAAGVKLLAGLISNLPVNDQMTAKFLNHPYFAALLIRKGALPARLYNKPLEMEELCFFSNWNAAALQNLLEVERAWLIAGRDEAEILVIVALDPAARLDPGKVAHCAAQFDKPGEPGFQTIVYAAAPFLLTDMAGNVDRLFDAVNQLTVIGKNQILDDAALCRATPQLPPLLDSSCEKKLEFLISGRLLTDLLDELRQLFQEWERQDRTQIWLEKMLRQILGVVEKYAADISAEFSLNLEKQLEEALSCATDFTGLFQYFREMITETLAPADPGAPAKRTAPSDLFQRVERYIRKNLAEPLTLQGLCEVMEVSQPYLSRLFRKYENQSFVEYLNDIRIAEAKRLMADHPDMLLKDVAALVGYKDPYYFSRIFKSVTGLAPSEYKSA